MSRSILSRVLLALGLVALASALLTFLASPYSLADHGALTVVGWGLAVKLVLGAVALVLGLGLGTAARLRRTVAGRAAGYTTWTIGTAALLALTLGALEVAITRIGWSWDLTRNQVHGLAPESLAVLKGLDADVRAEAFYSPQEPQAAQVGELLARYAAASARFRVEVIDPFRAPERLGRLGISRGGARILLRQGDTAVAVRGATEEAVTGGLLQLTRRGARRVYLLTGHGERSRADTGSTGLSAVADSLQAQGLELVDLSLLAGLDVPGDAGAVLVVAPQTQLLEAERVALERYLERGGHVGIFLEPGAAVGLEGLLARWGFRLNEDVLRDESEAARSEASASLVLVTPSASHPATASVARLGLAFPTARSLSAASGATLAPSAIAMSGKQSRGIPTGGAAGEARRGPLAVAAVVQQEVHQTGHDPEQARLLVVGDADFCSNGAVGLLANAQFFVGAVEWLAEGASRIPIVARTRDPSRLVQTPVQASALRSLTADIVPALLLAIGLVVWVVRRG